MKLTKANKALLIKWGYSSEDIPQIEKAIGVSKYYLHKKEESTPISSKQALELLGQEKFLSGIARSAFHYSAFRENDNVQIFFDSKRLFR